jgi:hypothetical protein
MNTPRHCGSCSACCTFLRIDSRPGFSTRFDTGEDIAKAAGEPCRYLGPQGCSIYEVRPIVCRRFRCRWLDYHKDFSENPLKAGYFGGRNTIFYIDKKLVPLKFNA